MAPEIPRALATEGRGGGMLCEEVLPMKLWIPAIASLVLFPISFACRAAQPEPGAASADKTAAAADRMADAGEKMAAAGEKLAAAAERTAAAAERVAALDAHREPDQPAPPSPKSGWKITHATSPEIIERAVLDGLIWLARHQNEDGSWSPASLEKRCTSSPSCIDEHAKWTRNYDEGVTGLALLAFLRRGSAGGSAGELIDPVAKARYKIDDVVARGLSWLKARQNPDGSFTPDRAFMYNEAIATLAMIAAYSATHSPEWKECAQRGVDFVEAAQRPSPSGKGLWGWRYASRMEIEKHRPADAGRDQFQRELMDSDTSITGWCAQMLHEAREARLVVKDESLEGALAFTRWAKGQNGLVGYIDPKTAGATVTGKNDHYEYHLAAMSALGMCTRLDTKSDPLDPFLALAAKRIAEDPPGRSKDPLAIDYYYWHFGTLALSAYDGLNLPNRTDKYWGHWRTYVAQALLGLQDRNPDACRQGGWITGDRWCYSGGTIYTTAINVLTLEAASKQ